MPSPSAARHRGSIIRQFSLQNQASAPTPIGRRGFGKQLSEDETRSKALDSVEVTGHGWSASGGERSPAARTGSSARPKPVRLAWADRKHDAAERPTGVEVVARKCQGQPRPLTVKAQRIANGGDKDSLVYTKQELAERLRVAWREREKRKANLDIFLARPVDGDGDATARSGEMRHAEIIIQDSVSLTSVSGCESSLPSSRETETDRVATEFPDLRPWRAESEGGDDRGAAVTDSPDFKTFAPAPGLASLRRRMESLDLPSRTAESSPRSDSGYGGTGKADEAEGEEEEEEEDATSRGLLDVPADDGKRPHGTAQERRASFRSGSLLNKTIDDSSPSPEAESSDEDDTYRDNSNEIKVFLKKNNGEKRPPLVRTLSAPTRNEPKALPLQAPSKPKLLPHYASSVDLGAVDEDPMRGRIVKSAPIRRKLKTCPSRRKHRERDQDSSDEDKNPREATKKKSSSRRKAASRSGTADIVTMVSLVSPATSDAEDSVIPVPEETWTPEERADATAAEKAADAPREATSFVIQKFVSLRKTTKTVSFVQHPPINRSYSASFPSRRAPAGTPIIIPTPVITNPALTPAQLQERERRQSPSVGDARGLKRKLVRTVSAPQVKGIGDARAERNDPEAAKKEFEVIDEGSEGGDGDGDGDASREPEFKSPKERECWLLYRKMLEKGVSVSFDTVLRGMLTPTEYRLRRNQLLSSC